MTDFASNTEPTSITSTASHSDFGLQYATHYQTIITAIESRRIVKMVYECDRLPRIFSPYIFRLANNGNYVVAGMQNSNPNGLNDDDQRRTFSLSKIQSMELTDQHFTPADTFDPNDKAVSTGIIASVVPWK